MTDLDDSRFRQVAAIDWARIARAHQFYTNKGYTYVEVPWAVPRKIVDATLPPGASPLSINEDEVLVGSAEQGFLDLLHSTKNKPIQPGKLLYAVSPCFRGEPVLTLGHTQLTFMKVELFCLESAGAVAVEYDRVSEVLIADAQEFMATEGVVTTRETTEEGEDLYCQGLELGSYGTRRWNNYRWAYGTGLAEPRFSTALHKVRYYRKQFPFRNEVR